MVHERWTKLERLVTSIITNPDSECLNVLKEHPDLLDEPITLDCSTLNNHCVCTVNFEYVNKPEHLIKCLRKRKCFHCQRYHCMRRAYDVITASTHCIHLAAALGKFRTFKFLHQRGCSLESRSGLHELRPLHLSIIHGHLNIFFYLLSNRVDINAPMKSNGTCYSPLMQAVLHNRKEMIRHLLMVKGLDLSYRNSLYQSPILFAVKSNNLDLVDLLLGAEEAFQNSRHGQKPSQLQKLQHPCAVLEAIKQDNVGVLKTLLDNGCKADYIFNGYHSFTTAAVLATIKNSHGCLELLLKHDADFTTKIDGFSPLDWARHLRWTQCIALLDEAGDMSEASRSNGELFDKGEGDTDSHSNDAMRSFDYFDRGGTVQEFNDEIDTGDFHTNNTVKATVLSPIIAVWNLSQWISVDDAINRLASLGHNVNVQDGYGRTSLHIAVEQQHIHGVRALLRVGADTEVRDVCEATPFWHAVFWNKESMIKELIAANAKMECSADENACKLGFHSPESQVSYDRQNAVLKTPLSIAVEKNFHETVFLLIEAGYDTSHENVDKLIEVARTESKQILNQHLNEPKTLFASTRNFIRRTYGVRISSIANQYDLPTRIKDSLLLKDVLDCAYSDR